MADLLIALRHHINVEFDTSPDRYRAVRWGQVSGRHTLFNDFQFATDTELARLGCTTAGIPYRDSDAVLEEATLVYGHLQAFESAPAPSGPYLHALDATDAAAEVPFGYGLFVLGYEAAIERYQSLCLRVDRVINRLVAFRSVVLGHAAARMDSPPDSRPGDHGEDAPPMPLSTFMEPAELTRALGLPDDRKAAVEAALRRIHQGNPACRDSLETPRKGEPRFLYRVAVVWSLLIEHLPRWR